MTRPTDGRRVAGMAAGFDRARAAVSIIAALIPAAWRTTVAGRGRLAAPM